MADSEAGTCRKHVLPTPFHSRHYAFELTKRCSSDNLEKLSRSLNNATIDLNLLQTDAARSKGNPAGKGGA